MKLVITIFLLIGFCPEIFAASPTYVICKRKTNGAIFLRASKCKRNETKIQKISSLTGATGATGATGTNGVDGEDGSIRIYGDGSAGALNINTTTTLSAVNKQYSNVIIQTGESLTVDSGTVIRVTGTFTNNGIITVRGHATGAKFTSSFGTVPAFFPAAAGNATVAGSQGALGDNSAVLAGGDYGQGMFQEKAENLLNPGVAGGSGGGAGAFNDKGGTGGGTFTVIASGAITNNGAINANGSIGQDGSGGGGGGIIILASKTSITNGAAGSITVNGGAGGASSIDSGAGGGGGGGVIHLISTTAPSNSGTISVVGGAAGANTVVVTSIPRTGGGGGGSCGGEGGKGSSVTVLNSSTGNDIGSSGFSLLTTADPTSMF